MSPRRVNPMTGIRVRTAESALGVCCDCGSTQRLTGSQDVERHTRLVRGGRRIRCHGSGHKPIGWRRALTATSPDSTPKD